MGKQRTFSDEIRRAVDGCGMSRYEICKRIGLDQAVMSRFMSGKAGLGLKTVYVKLRSGTYETTYSDSIAVVEQ